MHKRMLRLAAFVALILPISGCDLIAAYLYPLPTGGSDGPAVSAAYTAGTATVQLTQGDTTQTVSLDVAPGSMYESYLGAMVTWENADGWTVMVNAYDESWLGGVAVPGIYGDMTINYIGDHALWTAGSYSDWGPGGCVVNVWEMSAEKVAGRVNCTQMRWSDGMNLSLDGPTYIQGQDPFDLTIDFEAEAPTVPPGQTS